MRRVLALTLAAVMVLVLIGAVVVMLPPYLNPTPLRPGATADEAWTHIHTNAALLGPTTLIGHAERRNTWRGTPRSIEWESRFYLPTNRLCATRTIIYSLDTNSVITRVGTRWKLTWPF